MEGKILFKKFKSEFGYNRWLEIVTSFNKLLQLLNNQTLPSIEIAFSKKKVF